MNIEKELQKIREDKKITRVEMAHSLNISPNTLKDIEYGKIRLTLENYLLICKKLELNPMQLLKENEEDQYIILSLHDLNELNKIVNKINSQTNIINDNHGFININNNND